MCSATTGRVASITGRERSDSTDVLLARSPSACPVGLAEPARDRRRSSPPRIVDTSTLPRDGPGHHRRSCSRGRSGPLWVTGPPWSMRSVTGTRDEEATMGRTQEPGGDYGYDLAHEDVQA